MSKLSFQRTVEPSFTDTRLIRTPRYYGQFSLSLGKALKFNPLNTDTSLLRTVIGFFLFEGEKTSVDSMSMFPGLSTPDREICRRQFETTSKTVSTNKSI